MIEYAETCCFARKITMTPALKGLSEFTEQLLYDVIKLKYPIDYTRAALIITDVGEFMGKDIRPEDSILHIFVPFE